MTNRRIWLAAGIVLLVIGVGFVLSVPHTNDGSAPRAQEVVATTTPEVTVHDTYRKGVHTLTGSLIVPNPCTPVSTEASILGDASTTERIALAITLTEDEGVCLQIPQKVTFSTTVTADADLPIDVSVNGKTASTTLQ